MDGLELLDWGNRFIRGAGKNRKSLERIQALMAWYEPDVVVLEDYTERESRRCGRVQLLIKAVARVAERKNVHVAWVPLREVRIRCGGSPHATKQHIALGIAARFPELQRILPPVRKIWMPEHYRMSTFDAVALGVTYVLQERGREAA